MTDVPLVTDHELVIVNHSDVIEEGILFLRDQIPLGQGRVRDVESDKLVLRRIVVRADVELCSVISDPTYRLIESKHDGSEYTSLHFVRIFVFVNDFVPLDIFANRILLEVRDPEKVFLMISFSQLVFREWWRLTRDVSLTIERIKYLPSTSVISAPYIQSGCSCHRCGCATWAF